LTINSPTEVKTCGGINICDEINNGKQSLSLDNNGKISISNGNAVQLPDASETNELQSCHFQDQQFPCQITEEV
jgi:hypothetical protein